MSKIAVIFMMVPIIIQISAQDCRVCRAKVVGLVRYPTTLVSEGRSVPTQCADNAHFMTRAQNTTCRSTGTWATIWIWCRCNAGYRENIINRNCEAIPSCPRKTEGLVVYPATLAPRRQAVQVLCADNAHLRAGSSPTVYCNSSGLWAQTTRLPECECDDGYRKKTSSGKDLCEAIPNCPAKTEGLVRYPTTRAPVRDSVTVTVKCADNARRITSLTVACNSDGTWSSGTPLCLCDGGYEEVNGICEARDVIVCQERSEGLVRYPTTLADVSGELRVTVKCADNAISNSSLVVACLSSGMWSVTNQPACSCKHGYRENTENGRLSCQALPQCQAKSEGLAQYPSTVAPISRSKSVNTRCADNAHIISGSSLRVRCNSDGSWSSMTPQCQCNSGYRQITSNEREMCEAIPVCTWKVVGLVSYPTELAPSGNPSSVTTQCADNAHIRSGSSLSVRCSSDGIWSGTIPQCDCNDGYRIHTSNGRSICQTIPSCPSKSIGLVYYPTTQAPVKAGTFQTLIVTCADNSHNTTSLEVVCTSGGSWANTNAPQCECDKGYTQTLHNGRTLCKVIHCDEKFEGLVYYPTTLGNHRASVKCIDHAISIEPDFSVWCGSDGQWSTAQNPQCQCIDGYRVSLQEERAFCEALPRCPAMSIDLLRYPSTYGGSTAELECADNAYSNSSDMTVECDVSGAWSEHTPPQCLCDDAYREALTGDEFIIICEAIPSCHAKSEGLVRYPTTLAPINGHLLVTLDCADNAIRATSSLNVTCNSDGTWSGEIPRCKCDQQYYESDIIDGRKICLAIPPSLCEAKSEALVRYPNWLAPIIGSVVVEIECADNAHLVSSSLNVTCVSSGQWSGIIPLCECDHDHHVVTNPNGEDMCQGDNITFTLEALLTISAVGLTSVVFLTIIIILLLCILNKRCKHSTAPTHNQLWTHKTLESSSSSDIQLGKVTSTFGNYNNYDKDEDPCHNEETSTTLRTEEQAAKGVENVGLYSMKTFTKPELSKADIPKPVLIPVQPVLNVAESLENMEAAAESDTKEDDSFVDEDDSFIDDSEGENCYMNVQGPQAYDNAVVNKESVTAVDYVEEADSEEEEPTTPTAKIDPPPNISEAKYDEVTIGVQPPQPYEYAVVKKKKSYSNKNGGDKSEKQDDGGTTPAANSGPPGNLPAAKYDDIKMNRKIRKPRNIEDVEEIYDVVVDQLSTRKESVGSKITAYAMYTVPATTMSELPTTVNMSYEAGDGVEVGMNLAYLPAAAKTPKSTHSYDTIN